MVSLALETATRSGSLALLIDDVCYAAAGDASRTHGERLPGELSDWLTQHGKSLDEVDYFVVVAGPGSFTGLRVGMATIQGLALAGGRQVIAVPTLDAMASARLDRSGPHDGLLVPCLDGQRGEIFYAAYDASGANRFDGCREVIAAEVARPEVAAERLAAAAAGRDVVMVGNGARGYADTFVKYLPTTRIEDVPVPIAEGAVRLAMRRVQQATAPHALRPRYLRRPDAELARERAAAARPARPEAPTLSGLSISRAISADDVSAVEALQRRSFTNAWGAEAIRWELENTDVARLYVMRGPARDLVAYCACWMIFDELHINSLAVDEASRRRGVARQLLRHVMRDAIAAGARGATLEVRRSNEAARALYEGLGFKVEAVRRDYYQEPREDALVLWNRAISSNPGAEEE